MKISKQHIQIRCRCTNTPTREQTRSALSRVHLPPTMVFRRLETTRCCFVRRIFPTEQNSTMQAKPCVAATRAQYGLSRPNKIPHCSAYAIGESSPLPASALWSWSGSKVNQFVPTPNTGRHATFHPNPCTRFWVILHIDRQTDRQRDKWTQARGRKHIPPPLLEVNEWEM